jgi:hypothetical protein
MGLALPVQSEDLPFHTQLSAISWPLPKEWPFNCFKPRDVCQTPDAFRPPHNLALFQSEDFPKAALWGSRFRSGPKTFPSALSMSRSPAPSRRIELSIMSCLINAFHFTLCISLTSPFDHVPIRRLSHDRLAWPVFPVRSEDLPFHTRHSAISCPLPKDWAFDRFMPSKCHDFSSSLHPFQTEARYGFPLDLKARKLPNSLCSGVDSA